MTLLERYLQMNSTFVQEPATIVRNPSLAYIPETRPARPDYSALVANMGHKDLALLSGDLSGLVRAVYDFADENYGYRFRCDGPILYRGTRFSYIPPEMLVTHNSIQDGKKVPNAGGKVVNAMLDAFEEEGLEGDKVLIALVGGGARDIVRGIKARKKIRTGYGGKMPEEKFDADGLIALPEGTPKGMISLEEIAAKVNERLLSLGEDLGLYQKEACWRQSAKWLNIREGEETVGHLFLPRVQGFYIGGPHEDILENLMGRDCDPCVVLHRRIDGLIDGVFVDPYWEHRPSVRIPYFQGQYMRTVRVAISHWPYIGINNPSEMFFIFSRDTRTYTSCNLVPINDCNPNHLADWNRIRESVHQPATRKEVIEMARQTAEATRRIVFLPIAVYPELIIHEIQRQSGEKTSVEQVAAKMTEFQLAVLEETINADPHNGIRLTLLSLEDNDFFDDPLFSTDSYKLFFPDGYKALHSYYPELLAEARGWRWGMARVGWKKTIQFAAKKARNQEELYLWFTPFYARDNPLVREVVKASLDKALFQD